MSNNDKEAQRSHQLRVLKLVNLMGVATHLQISRDNIVHERKLKALLTRLVEAGYLEEVGEWHYYAHAPGRASRIYKLTEVGDFCISPRKGSIQELFRSILPKYEMCPNALRRRDASRTGIFAIPLKR